jgi:mRNA-degrading endonuclease RelE of RelBE toxin-antitoxin system
MINVQKHQGCYRIALEVDDVIEVVEVVEVESHLK